MNRQLVLAVLLTLTSPLTRADDRLRLAFDIGWAPRSGSLPSESTYPEFAETARVTATQDLEGSSVLAGEAQIRFTSHLGVALGIQGSSETGSAAISASLPHPFFFGQPRSAETQADRLEYAERAVHTDLVALLTRGRIGLRGFAGVSFFRVKAQLIQKVQYSSTYPFDTATIDSPIRASVDGSAAGFNLGAGADFNLGRHFALGAQLRYSQAKVELAPIAAANTDLSGVTLAPAEVDAGGFTATAGVRVRF